MITNKIKKAFDHCTPNNIESILQECNKVERKNNMEKKKEFTIFNKLAYLALGIIITFGGLLSYNRLSNMKIDATVLLDVNPSIELDINKKNKIVKVNPMNEDAKTILNNMDLKDTDLNVAVNAIVGSMLREGYITEYKNSVLVSVISSNNAKGDEIQSGLIEEINNILKQSNIEGSVLSQTFTSNNENKELADEHNISIGKAKLINEILLKDKTLVFEELAKLSINELNLINNSKNKVENSTGNDTTTSVKTTGQASSKSYIGEAKAKEIALKHANEKESNIYDLEVEFDSENGIFCYEVEFKTKSYEYDYEINASNGDIVESNKEKNDDYFEDNDYDDDDDDDNTTQSVKPKEPSSSTQTTTYITKAKAKSIALSKAGVSESEITEYEIEFDKKDSSGEVDKYEISFKKGQYEYEVDINAVTGKIIEYKREIDD